jgi:chromosome segregation ATPase
MILAVLALLLVASLWRTVSVEREKRQVAQGYEEVRQLVQELTEERDHLSGELLAARQTVEDQAGNLATLQQEFASVQARLDETVTQIASLQRDYEELEQRNTSLASQLQAAVAEKEQLQAKLSSLKELRLAIRNVKQQLRTERWAAWGTWWREQAQRVREADQVRLVSGNRGYVVKQGKSTLGVTPRLHVHVLEPQSP